MKLNWKRFIGLFLLFNLVLMCTGCTAAWIGAIQALLPALSAAVSAILSFVMALEGKTVPASVSNAIQKVVADIQTELKNVSTLVADVQVGGAAVISKIQAGMQSVLSNLGSILSGLSISDDSTIRKVTELVGLAVAAVQSILAIIPLALKVAEAPKGQISNALLESYDHTTANNLKNTHKAMQTTYTAIVTTPTESMDVNTALEALPQQLP